MRHFVFELDARRRQTDRQTDGQTDGRARRIMRPARWEFSKCDSLADLFVYFYFCLRPRCWIL